MFEEIGFIKEYFYNDKYYGKIKCEKDRDVIGWNGRKTEIVSEVLILDNKKKLKIGMQVSTILYPLSGKMLKNVHQ